MWVEGTPSAPQERLRPYQIAELCHGDAAKGERRRVVAQGDPVQCTEGIAHGEPASRRSDLRVHRNPAIFVTHTLSTSGASVARDDQARDRDT
jgi:hypothetical protein